MHLATPEFSEFWIPSFLFEGDPFLRDAQKASGTQAEGGFAPVLRLERNSAGLLVGHRDIRFDEGLAERNRMTPAMMREIGR